MGSSKLFLTSDMYADETFLSTQPNLRHSALLHINVTDGTHLFNHLPVEGLHIHYNNDDIDVFLRRMSVSWIHTISYVTIWHRDKYYATIYNDAITINHPCFRRLKTTSALLKYHESLTDRHLIYSEPPKVIQDLEKQLQREHSPITCFTFIRMPPQFEIQRDDSYGSKHRIVTPLWLAYYLIYHDNTYTDKGNEVRYYLDSPRRYIEYLDVDGVTLQDLVKQLLRHFKPYTIDYPDIFYKELITIETLHYGRLIRCNI